ncbi:NHL repeat-containing protein [Mongoliitalea daihaiensis]|uniref:hypothetical protein n=1 Tax=Mongoliitalea daihaiensis TaxID=2782006 RepID=UPI001F350D97|nr:hypothetical protein [Mongoliitalea daihaiensis]
MITNKRIMRVFYNFYRATLLLVFSAFLASCQGNESSKANDSSKLAFEIVVIDSVQVEDVLASLFLFQYATEEYLFFRDAGASKIFVFDRTGKPVTEWAKTGDVPGVFSMVADNLSLTPEGNLLITDKVHGLIVFSREGEVLLQNRVYQYQTGFHGFINIFRKNQVIGKNGKTYVLHHLDLMDDIQEVGQAFFEKRMNLLMTDLETRETKQLIPFPNESKFLAGLAYPFEDFRPRFFFDQSKEKLYLMFQNEPVLYTYSWKGEIPVLESSQRLELDEFYENEGLEYGQVPYGVLNGTQLGFPFPSSIESLEMVGEVFLIHYKPGPSPSALPDWEKVKNGSADESLKISVRQQQQWKTVALVDGKVFPVSRPAMWNDSYRVIDEELWWMKPLSKDKEDESFTVYRGKLQLMD